MKNNYNLMDTIGKTLKVNDTLEKIPTEFISYNNKQSKNFMFDFSLLDNNNINPDMIQKIKNQCFKDISIVNRFTFISESDNGDFYNSFNNIVGKLYFKPLKVYSNSKDKYIYTILQLVKVEIQVNSRKSLYNEYETINNIDVYIGSENSISELEIA